MRSDYLFSELINMQQLKQSLDLPNLEEILERNPVVVTPETLLLDVVTLMSPTQESGWQLSEGDVERQTNKTRQSSYVLVVSEEQLLGIFTERDLVRLVASQIDLSATTIAEVMTQPVLTMARSQCQNIFSIWSFLRQHSLHYVPIISDCQKLLGVISADRLLQAINPTDLESLVVKQHITESESILRSFFDSSPMMMGIIELLDDDIRHLCDNATTAKFFGLTPEAMQNQLASEMGVPQEHLHYWIERYREAQKIGSPIRFEYIHHQDDSARWLSATVISIPVHVDRYPRFAYMVEDITDRQQAEEELERFFNLTPSMMCIAGLDGYFKRLNSAFSQILGYTEAELLAEPFINFVHPEDRATTIAEVASLSKGKTTIAFENRYRTKDSSYRWLLWTAIPYPEEQRIYAAARDITERKQTESALRESEERWQLALRGANDGIWDWNVRTNEVFFSKRWKQMLGYKEHEINNSLEEWSKRVHPDDLDGVMQLIQNHFAQKTPFYISEHRVLCKDGSYKWILDRGQALWDEAGNVVRMAGSHTDISDRKRAELELKQERDFITAILNTVGALVAVLDRQGRIISFNRTCEQVTGYNFKEVVGRQVWEFLILPEEEKAIRAVFERLLIGQLPNQYENHWLAKDGSRHLISWSNTALFDSQGEVEFIVATGIDFTEQRRVRDKLEHQYRQTKLLAEVTRKIRRSIELEEILQTTVTEVQHLLACDRVMIVELRSNNTAVPISEAILPNLPPMLGYELTDPLLLGKYVKRYCQGKILAIADLANSTVTSEVKILLKQFAIKAKLVVPILSQNSLKGLLVAHQCTNTRQWQNAEIKLLQQLADQIGVAISQAQLLDNLEEMVEERTIELTTANQRLQAEIAERQLTEAALRENQQKIASILDNADEAIISINEQQQIQLFNRGAEKIFGYNLDEVKGKSLDLIIPQAFRSIHRQHIRDFSNSAELARTMAERTRSLCGLRKNGEEFPIEASISKLRSRGGMIFTVMLKDITKRLQAEESLRRSEEQLRLITDALPVLISYVDNQQRYRYNNRTYETWFGKSRDSLLGLHISEVLGKDYYQKALPYIETALSGHSVTFEIEPRDDRGNSYWVSATYIPDFASDGSVKGFFAMVDDITERKAIEQMKSEFVSVASHEMRTPLTSIHGVLKLMAAGHLGNFSERGQEMIEIAIRNTDRLVRLINDVLDLERMESGRETIEREHCSSAELIKQVSETMRSMAQQHGVTIEADLNSIELWVDRDRILQTLTNLLSNAIKFSPAGSKVWVTSQQQGKDVLFTVKDEGRGIPADKLEIIFERFQQVDASDSRKKGGTGLGLAICRHIVEQHGGKIWAESVVGEGSTFFFNLPQ